MARQRLVHLITITALTLALGIGIARKHMWRSGVKAEPRGPQDAINAMLDAARNGDVAAYLGSYSGPLRTSLEQVVRESTVDGFRKYLRESQADIKGVAVFDPQEGGEDEVTVRVEYVYQERNEAQTVYLGKKDGAWKIVRLDGAESVKTPIPYGTPVE